MERVNYEVTLTVSPKYVIGNKKYGKMIASEQWNYLQYFLFCLLNEYDIDYEFRPEFHKNFNIHVHGMVTFYTKPTKLIISTIYKKLNQLGRSNFKPVFNVDNWLRYMRKEAHEFDYKCFMKSFKNIRESSTEQTLPQTPSPIPEDAELVGDADEAEKAQAVKASEGLQKPDWYYQDQLFDSL